jgi:ATP-dependent Clp protease protease subunit
LWGISARNFINDLGGLGAVKTIKARINSYGGDVFDGIAIYNALKYHEASVEVTVYGIAASIASVIAMAGDKILMPENAFMFVHDPLGFAAGNAADMRELADALDKIKGGLVRSNAAKTGQSDEKIAELMSADTWLNE